MEFLRGLGRYVPGELRDFEGSQLAVRTSKAAKAK